MHQHSRTAPLEHNESAILVLLCAWNSNFFGAKTHALPAYNQNLRRFAAYLLLRRLKQSMCIVSYMGTARRDGAITHYAAKQSPVELATHEFARGPFSFHPQLCYHCSDPGHARQPQEQHQQR